MKTFLLIFIFFVSSYSVNAQKTDSSIAKNIVYVEAFGIGGYGSINYERLVFWHFLNQSISFGFRAGFSTYHIRDFTNTFNPDLIFPFGISALYGNSHRIELGIGQVISSTTKVSSENGEAIRDTQLHLTGSIGYRYQKKEGGIFIRVVYSPIYENYNHFRNWGGVSFGYVF